VSRGPAKNNGPAEVGVWAKEKLDALARYLDFYTKVLKNTPWWRTVYFDGFAGGGRAAIRPDKQSNEPLALFNDGRVIEADERELIDGSPRIALSIPNQFDRYVFVDPDPVRTAELRGLKDEHGDKVVVLDCTATEGVDWLLQQNIKKSSHRGVAFLDPFGARLDWESVQKLAETGLFEVIINFALDMGIVRVLTNSADLPDAWAARLDRYFGGHEWFDEVYHRPDELFGAGELQKRPDYRERLLELYRAKLRMAFGHVSAPRLIRNTRGAPLYYLLWAGPHKKGLEGADYVLKMGERLSRSG
jgi:three-Cys-motif partner protein